MTSPALVVLTLALVCSTFTATGQTADHASEHAMHIKQADPNTSTKMRIWTNHHDYIVNNRRIFNQLNHKESNEINDNYIYTNNKDIHVDKEIKNNFYDEDNELGENINNKHSNMHKDKETVQTSKQQQFDDIYTETVENIETNDRNIKFLNHDKHKKPINAVKAVTDEKFINIDDKDRIYFKPNIDSTNQIKKSVPNPFKHWKRVKREDPLSNAKKCEEFVQPLNNRISHPHDKSTTNPNNKTYYGNVECVLTLNAPDNGQVIQLTFVDVFHIEDHPKCAYDYLEVRDGERGYARLLGRFCGDKFPSQQTSSGPSMWLKFKADETIEYEGFYIKVDYKQVPGSYKIPQSCYLTPEIHSGQGMINSSAIDTKCTTQSAGHALDVLWIIQTPENTDIHLNFTTFTLAEPNICEENLVQVFGYITEEEKELQHFCGSAAVAVSTRDSKDKSNLNVMHVRLYLSQNAIDKTKVIAYFTTFRTLGEDDTCRPDEFDCEDNTCIDNHLNCNDYANCRLKTDEMADKCHTVHDSLLKNDHIVVILVIFCLILSGMSFVFLFKCIKKLYQDHKAIKEHIRQSTEDRLDELVQGGSIILRPNDLSKPSRASLERENHTNDFLKQQRSISQHNGLPQQTSIESDFHDSPLDLDDEPWQRNVDSVPVTKNVKAERNGRTRRADTSRKEESLRSRKESIEEKREIRDAAVGAPDTKESGCQTRESLFQADTAPSSDGSNSANNSRGFSTFGYSGATLVRPSPPPAATPAPMISSTQIELLRQLPSQESTHKSQKKLTDRRPMSAETTRSAPDVIIVSKPIR